MILSIILLLGVLTINTSYAQTEKYDIIYLDDLCINIFCLKDSISNMYNFFGKPDREKLYETSNEEWAEPMQKKFFYGMQIKNINNVRRIEYECIFKELRKDSFFDIITGLVINSNKYVLNYKDCEIMIGDNISNEKFQRLFPNSYLACIDSIENCTVIVLIMNQDGKLSMDIASLKLIFEKSILQSIIVDYNLK